MARKFILLLCAGLLVSACGSTGTTSNSGSGSNGGGSTASSPGGSSANPCSLLTAADINTVTGIAVNDGKSDPTAPIPGCSWAATSDSDNTVISDQLDPSTDSFDAALKTNGTSDVSLQMVPNLGEKAFYFGQTDGSLLEVKTSHGVFSVSVTLASKYNETAPSGNNANKCELLLAQKGLSRLG